MGEHTGPAAVGDVIGERFRLVAPLPARPSPSVFRAQDLRRDMPAVVRVFGPPPRPVSLAQRAEALVSVRHPNLASVLGVGCDPRRCWLASEHVAGEPLRGMAVLPAWRVAEVVRDLADALSAVHATGLVHGQVRPSNVVVDPSRRTRLLDLGAKQLRACVPVPDLDLPPERYFAPESLDGAPSSPAIDVYALGVLALDWLTRPGPRAEDATVLAARPANAVAALELDPAWCELIAAMTEVSASDRPTAEEVARLTGDLWAAMGFARSGLLASAPAQRHLPAVSPLSARLPAPSRHPWPPAPAPPGGSGAARPVRRSRTALRAGAVAASAAAALALGLGLTGHTPRVTPAAAPPHAAASHRPTPGPVRRSAAPAAGATAAASPASPRSTSPASQVTTLPTGALPPPFLPPPRPGTGSVKPTLRATRPRPRTAPARSRPPTGWVAAAVAIARRAPDTLLRPVPHRAHAAAAASRAPAPVVAPRARAPVAAPRAPARTVPVTAPRHPAPLRPPVARHGLPASPPRTIQRPPAGAHSGRPAPAPTTTPVELASARPPHGRHPAALRPPAAAGPVAARSAAARPAAAGPVAARPAAARRAPAHLRSAPPLPARRPHGSARPEHVRDDRWTARSPGAAQPVAPGDGEVRHDHGWRGGDDGPAAGRLAGRDRGRGGPRWAVVSSQGPPHRGHRGGGPDA